MRGIRNGLIVSLIGVMSMVGCWGCTGPKSEPSVLELNAYQKSAQSAVRIVLLHKAGRGHGTGSGGVFYRSEREEDSLFTYRLITAGHLIQPDMSQWHVLISAIDVRDPFNEEILATNGIQSVDYVNRELDFAIITFRSSAWIETMVMPKDPSPVRLGDTVYMSGCDNGILPFTRSGRVAIGRYFDVQPSNVDEYHERHPEDFFGIDITASGGASGSSVTNERGEFVGIYIMVIGGHESVYQRGPGGMFMQTPLIVHSSKPHINCVTRYFAIYRDLQEKQKLHLIGHEDVPQEEVVKEAK
jgi:hypothetical protein